ncbi:chromate transporter [Rhodoferax sp. TBRC 17660]|uniref:Chromate transporter n=1 Tax=Rhodoferax potami TaxID=3068338 RepID=A0ABU3KS54_9BURK|nr:chromate transporter [Rhodoferax sp. TBRC 17660]MDT7520448.1 chromate transporter [Rhodoferax sp. TBRC 17660]
MSITLTAAQWFELFTHFASLSLLAVGGAITTAPDMQRFLVVEKGWLDAEQFSNCIALAQAAPGPNILFVPLLGWTIGLNAAGGLGAGWYGLGLAMLGVFLSMLGIMLPSSILTFTASRWGHRNRELRAVRAFKQGMAPLVIALLVATGWILAANHKADTHHLALWAVTALSTLLVWKTKIHLLWLLGAGALAGWMGWI